MFKVGVRVGNKECRGDIWHDCELRNCFSSTGSWQTTTCSWDPFLCLQSPLLWLLKEPLTLVVEFLTLVLIPGPSLVLERSLVVILGTIPNLKPTYIQSLAAARMRLIANLIISIILSLPKTKRSPIIISNMFLCLVFSATFNIDPDSDLKSFPSNRLWV